VGPQGRVVAVEPSSREVARIQRNVTLNAATNVSLVHAALGDREGTATLKVAQALHAGQNSLGGFAYDDVRLERVEEVPVITLDALADRCGLGTVDVLKIDVEGAEAGVLRGGQRVLERSKPLVIIEVLDGALRLQGATAEDVLTQLRSSGYSLFVFDEISGLPRPIREGDVVDGSDVVAVHRDRPWEGIDGTS
jgi:FkbM family methyltransferase